MAERLLIPQDKSVIAAADIIEEDEWITLVKETGRVPGIGGYKVGFTLGYELSLKRAIALGKEHSDHAFIFDHQKAGTDVPDLASKFAKVVSRAKADGVIIFPFGGAQTEEDWIKACQDTGAVVIVGGHMTQKKFLRSEGGFIADDAPEMMYQIGAELGIRDFVVPGNKVQFVGKYRSMLDTLIGVDQYRLYSPGFVTQGGEISEYGKEAGNKWHAIVGRDITTAVDKRAAAERLTAQLK